MRTETVKLDEARAVEVRRVIEESPQMVGLVGALAGRKIVGVVVEEPEPAPAVEAPEAEKKARGRK